MYYLGYGNYNQAPPKGFIFSSNDEPRLVRYNADIYPEAIYDWILMLSKMSWIQRKYDDVKTFFSGKKSKTNKTSNIIVLLGCSLDEVKQHIEKQFTELMFWENHGIYWEVDHIIPCDKFDLTDIEQQKQCFHHSNLQPLIKTENRQKSNK